MLGDASGNVGVGDLHEEGATATQQEDAFTMYTPHHGIVRKR